MKEEIQEPTSEDVEKLYSLLDKEAKQGGYFLNLDSDFVRGLVRGLIVNDRRYGYKSCPCRLAADDKNQDLDIICPCYYRDEDVIEYGACYCALYVSNAVIKGEKELGSIPERRPSLEKRQMQKDSGAKVGAGQLAAGQLNLSVPVWRCLVCGYLCGRDDPPEICPICKASKERFERFL